VSTQLAKEAATSLLGSFLQPLWGPGTSSIVDVSTNRYGSQPALASDKKGMKSTKVEMIVSCVDSVGGGEMCYSRNRLY